VSSTSSRLVELRRKTDRQLLLVIQRELNRGMTLASVVVTQGSPLHLRAEKAYEKAKALLTKLESEGQDERSQLDSRLRELRAALDRIPAQKLQRHTASSA
jgi:hypothetical protein